METHYGDFVREHVAESGYGWGKYRRYNGGTTNIWNFYELEKFKKKIADNAEKIVWAMAHSLVDGSFYFDGKEWRRSSGAKLAFFRDKAAGRVKGYQALTGE